MKVRDLIDSLQSADPDAEVRIMSQESYPFENAISGVWTADPTAPCNQCGLDGDDPTHDLSNEEGFDHEPDGFKPSDDFNDRTDTSPVLYIVEGRQEGYGTRTAWEEAF